MEAYLIQSGFLKFNFGFEILFAIITILVSIFAFRIYELTKKRELKLFSIGFLMFGLSYLVRAAMTFVRIPGCRECMRLRGPVMYWQAIVGQAHVFFFMLGLVLLIYMTLQIRDRKIMAVLFGVIVILLFGARQLALFHVLSAFLMIFVVSYYYNNYQKHRKFQTGIVLVAFIFIFLAQISLIFSVHDAGLFMLGRLLELAGYLCILGNLALTLKK